MLAAAGGYVHSASDAIARPPNKAEAPASRLGWLPVSPSSREMFPSISHSPPSESLLAPWPSGRIFLGGREEGGEEGLRHREYSVCTPYSPVNCPFFCRLQASDQPPRKKENNEKTPTSFYFFVAPRLFIFVETGRPRRPHVPIAVYGWGGIRVHGVYSVQDTEYDVDIDATLIHCGVLLQIKCTYGVQVEHGRCAADKYTYPGVTGHHLSRRSRGPAPREGPAREETCRPLPSLPGGLQRAPDYDSVRTIGSSPSPARILDCSRRPCPAADFCFAELLPHGGSRHISPSESRPF